MTDERKPKLFAVGDIVRYSDKYCPSRFYVIVGATNSCYLLWDILEKIDDRVVLSLAEDYGAWTKL